MNHCWVFINDGGADCETPLLLSALCSWVHQHIPPACWEASINSSILCAAILVKERKGKWFTQGHIYVSEFSIAVIKITLKLDKHYLFFIIPCISEAVCPVHWSPDRDFKDLLPLALIIFMIWKILLSCLFLLPFEVCFHH